MTIIIEQIRQLLSDHHEQVRQRHFMAAAMGASALLASADGEISFAELIARDYVLERVEQLQAFPANKAADCFRDYADTLAANRAIGQEKILTAVRVVTGDRELSELLIRICVAIAKADRQLKPEEITIIELLAQELGIPAPDIELGSQDPKRP